MFESERERRIEQLFLLKPEECIKELEKSDQEHIQYLMRELVDNMPKELRPQLDTSKEEDSQFPNMFTSGHRQYEYSKAVEPIAVLSMRSIKESALRYENLMSTPKEPASEPKLQTVQEKTDIVQEEADNENSAVNDPLEGNVKEPIKEALVESSSDIQAKLVEMSFMPRSTQKLTGYSPFIPSQHNFLDPKANSKSLQSKYPHIRFTDNSHNITALAQQAKSVAFANNMAFPSAVMGGTLPPPHTTTFAKDSPYDISDVLRYTFHDRPRQTVYDQTLKNNKQTERLSENPFVHVPKKYS